MVPNVPFPSRQKLKRAPHLCLATNGWSDPNTNSIVGFTLTNPVTQPVFWSSMCTGSQRHTAEYLCKVTKDVIKDVAKELDVEQSVICGFASDNAKNMLGVQSRIQKEIPSVFASGCAVHVTNLLVQDMFKIPLLKHTFEEAVIISNYIRSRTALVFSLKQLQQQDEEIEHRWKLKLPANTRWYSVGACISSVVENEQLIKISLSNNKLIGRYKNTKKDQAKFEEVEGVVGDDSFWQSAQRALAWIEPVLNALADLESDNCCLSMVCELVGEVKDNDAYKPVRTGRDQDSVVVVAVKNDIRHLIQRRWEFVNSGAVGIAYLLDPTKPSNKLIGEEREKAIEQMMNYAEKNGTADSRDDVEAAARRLLRDKSFWPAEAFALASKSGPFFWWFERATKYPT